jgi:hypothetical protein
MLSYLGAHALRNTNLRTLRFPDQNIHIVVLFIKMVRTRPNRPWGPFLPLVQWVPGLSRE